MAVALRWLSMLWLVLPVVSLGEPPNPVKQAIQQETALLSSCAIGQCPVFYVAALGRNFPIPSRYRQIAPDESMPEFTGFQPWTRCIRR